MQNFEIKLPLPDPSRARARLRELGAEDHGRRQQRDVFYPVERGWLKLRWEPGGRNSLMSYRRVPDGNSMRNDYAFVDTDDPDALHSTLLHALGQAGEVRKERNLWTWRHTRIHLDDVERVGCYLEVETVLAEIDEVEGREEFDAVIECLGLDPGSRIDVPYRDLLPREDC